MIKKLGISNKSKIENNLTNTFGNKDDNALNALFAQSRKFMNVSVQNENNPFII